jgi:hypothetical protein
MIRLENTTSLVIPSDPIVKRGVREESYYPGVGGETTTSVLPPLSYRKAPSKFVPFPLSNYTPKNFHFYVLKS